MGFEDFELNPYKSTTLPSESVPFRETSLAYGIEFVGSMFPGYYSFVTGKYIEINPEMENDERLRERMIGVCLDMFVLGESMIGYFGMTLGS